MRIYSDFIAANSDHELQLDSITRERILLSIRQGDQERVAFVALQKLVYAQLHSEIFPLYLQV